MRDLATTDAQNPNPLSGVGGGRQPPQVKGRPVNSAGIENQPSAGAMEPRTGHTSLVQRIATVLTSFIQHFTGRTESKPVTGEAAPAAGETSTLETAGTTVPAENKPVTGEAAPAAGEMPAEDPKISDPTSIIKADPPSPDAAEARYKTATLVVGETPVRIYAKNSATLGEIQKTLSKPGLLWDSEIRGQQGTVMNNLEALGFSEEVVARVASSITTGGSNITGCVEGNENIRQDKKAKKKDEAAVGSFQSCQAPDEAKIVGAKTVEGINSLLQTLAECADRCTGASGEHIEREKVAGRKQIVGEVLNFCNKMDRVVTLERTAGGNNMVSGGRIYNPISSGPSGILAGFLKSPDGFSPEEMKEFAKNYRHASVEQAVQFIYQTLGNAENGAARPALKAAYENYCKDTGQTPTNLDELLFNNDLKTLFNERNKGIAFIKEMKLSPEKEAEQIALCQKSVEQRFQTWLGKHADRHDDGSITIDVGHVKIMVSDKEQLNSVTLGSLDGL
jgi:hypothetical protein